VFLSTSQTPQQLELQLTPLTSLIARAEAEAAARAMQATERPALPAAPDLADQIKKHAELHGIGVLDDDEFRRAKAAILDKMSQ
jgi:hypothetical protein